MLQPVDFGAEFQQGLQRGQQMARERAVEGALRDLTSIGPVIEENPEASARRRKAEGVLAAYAPDRLGNILAIEERRARSAAAIAEQQRRARLGTQAVTDPEGAARTAIGEGDFELAKTL